jgi:hypothetical protein
MKGVSTFAGRWPLGLAFSGVVGLLGLTAAVEGRAGTGSEGPYRVLPAIVRSNLAIFPVVADRTYDTSELLTLDDGIRSGEVVVTEEGNEQGLVRGRAVPIRSGAEVNQLVLYNNANRPLLLLAGEIVTGGKQDRIIGADRIVPPKGGPMDLNVFCVEPGRWTESSATFGSMRAQMAQPSVRTPAMAERNQSEVWAQVRSSNARITSALPPSAAPAVGGTSSYARVFASPPVEAKLAEYGGQAREQTILRELREKGAVGVVVAVNGHVEWADVFASTDLLAKYWPKLMRSYVAEAMTTAGSGGMAELSDAQAFMAESASGREVVETEPGVYARTETSGDGFRAFTLRGLLPGTEYNVHTTKMAD